MSSYPDTVATFREKTNLPGVTFVDPDKATIYADDLIKIEEEIVALENTLGCEPYGLYGDVTARLNDVDQYIAGINFNLENGLASKQDSLGFVAENVANKDTTTTLGTSDTKYPSQKAVKAYVDAAIIDISANSQDNTKLPLSGGTMSGTIDSCDILPVTTSTHTLGTADASWLESHIDKLYLNSAAYLDGAVTGKIGINTSVPSETLDIKGNFSVKDSDSATKAYRFRTSGYDLDLESGGRPLHISTFENADYTGLQRHYLMFKTDNNYASAYLNWEFKNSSDNAVFTIRPDDATTGNILLSDGFNIMPGTSTGTKIGTASNQKIAFFNAIPVIQPSNTPADATDLSSVITLVNDLKSKLVTLGLIS